MEHVKEITYHDTYAVRNPVLRPGKPVESCHFEGDELITTKHFGVFSGSRLVGVVSAYANASSINEFPEENQLQLRGMAILEDFREKKLGVALVQAVEEYANAHHFSIIWFNARETAVKFYEKLGYKIKNGPFDISDIGPHYIMYKVFGD